MWVCREHPPGPRVPRGAGPPHGPWQRLGAAAGQRRHQRRPWRRGALAVCTGRQRPAADLWLGSLQQPPARRRRRPDTGALFCGASVQRAARGQQRRHGRRPLLRLWARRRQQQRGAARRRQGACRQRARALSVLPARCLTAWSVHAAPCCTLPCNERKVPVQRSH